LKSWRLNCCEREGPTKECYECAFQKADPPQCLGHFEGPTPCCMFMPKSTQESRLLAHYVIGCEERQITPVEHPLGIVYDGPMKPEKQ